jgi:large subunit ribosomal protein L9
MAQVELILLQRVEKLGQMGDVVKVKPGYARNFLLPQKRAIRANKANLEKFEQQRAQLEALNIKRREEAERVAERVGMASPSPSSARPANPAGLYGSVQPRHRRRGHRRRPDGQPPAGHPGTPDQDAGPHPRPRRAAPGSLARHPEVARSVEEAEKQTRGEAVAAATKAAAAVCTRARRADP